MKVKKVFNNNILLAEDERDLEIILMGKGIGYGLKPGDLPDESKIEKKFKLNSEDMQDKFIRLVNDIPANYLELTKQIVEFAEHELNTTFDDFIYIGLADHLTFAIKRAKEKEYLNNALHWEIKKFYKKEYDVALKALDIIAYHESVEMTEDEASFIAMHFVNGQQVGEEIQRTVVATNIIQDILSIVKFFYGIDLDEDSINYSRFITHIRFFLQRAHHGHGQTDDFLFEQVKIKYPETYECSLRIKKYLDTTLDIELSNDELLYFMLHIKRLTERERKENE